MTIRVAATRPSRDAAPRVRRTRREGLLPSPGVMSASSTFPGSVRVPAFILAVLTLGVLLCGTGPAMAAGDTMAPSGTIGRPASIEAGKSAIFTANVSDDPFGSGIDPNGYTWTAPGFEPRTGASTTYTFPAAGRYTVTLSYRDLAGNAATTTVNVDVVGDQSVLPPAGILLPRASIKPTSDRLGIIVTLSGEIEPVMGVKPVTGEPLLRTTVCRSSMTLSLRKGTASLGTSTVNLVRRTCAYRTTLTITRKKLGTAKSLNLVVRFNENPAMRRTSKTFVLKVPKLPKVPVKKTSRS